MRVSRCRLLLPLRSEWINQSTVSEERSIKDGFLTKTAGLFPLRSLLAALHFHPCFLTHVSTRSFVGLLRLNWSVKISNKSVVSYEHNNLKSHFMQSVFCQLHNRVQSACGLHHNYSENTELHRVSQINTHSMEWVELPWVVSAWRNG